MIDKKEKILMELTVNGKRAKILAKPGRRLLDFIREDLGLTGTKEGCAEGECGSCTILLDGIGVLSCLTPLEKANGRKILTIEGVGTPTDLHPLQEALLEEGGVQCGMCTPGVIIAGIDLLSRNPHPTREEIVEGVAGSLCRCTGYQKIIKAIESVVAVDID